MHEWSVRVLFLINWKFDNKIEGMQKTCVAFVAYNANLINHVNQLLFYSIYATPDTSACKAVKINMVIMIHA